MPRQRNARSSATMILLLLTVLAADPVPEDTEVWDC
jgi:hypothetical protein